MVTHFNCLQRKRITKVMKFKQEENILEQSFARGGLQRPFMGEESQAFKDTKQFANKKFKDISLGNIKIT